MPPLNVTNVDSNPKDEGPIRNQVLDKFVVMLAILVCVSYSLVLIRTSEIGWVIWDLFQLIIVCSIIAVTVFRDKLSPSYKVIFLIVLNSVVGIIGMYTIGMLAGSAFYLPLAAVIVTLFYSKTAVAWLVVATLFFLGFIVVGFAYGELKSIHSHVLLMNSYSHWAVYIFFQVAFFVTICMAILNYRQSIENLVNEVNKKRDETQCLIETLKKLSFLDGLTNITNRRMFDITFVKEWRRAHRNGSTLSIIMLDIDSFKPYNDHYGHLQGDKCIKQVAHALNAVVKRTSDVVARFGGEEFVLLLPDSDIRQAVQLAQSCRNAILELQISHEFSAVQGLGVVSVSSGVSSVIPTETTQPLSLLDAADKLMYKAKINGRNRVEQD